MMELTDRHARFLLRLISRRARLYTEMVVATALLRRDAARFLRYSAAERPLALQVGGADPAELAQCARLAEDAGFDEINLNVGCPSDRVRSGRFGACLMAEPEVVAASVAAMASAARIPVTVKTRIGIDRDESGEQLSRLLECCRGAGCRIFIVHARNAWLDGLSPSENRDIPPLRYEVVYALKRQMAELSFVLNGGIKGFAAIDGHLACVDGVMLGREAYYNPMALAEVDQRLFGEPPRAITEREIALAYADYVERELRAGTPLRVLTQHLIPLYQNVPGARRWRRVLSERSRTHGAGIEVIHEALAEVESGDSTSHAARRGTAEPGETSYQTAPRAAIGHTASARPARTATM
jgi:tRNA-dihydrouridine synthase A